ncbi:MAG: Uncharacterized protein G01um1014107_342 [Parcubacteria group bacterium Gr01-1014_107]|nr:MAG: Uncharacterized protein G01um1014107_342 [Parcubacteria group bacterium Gr01-1014_107]
MTLFSWLTTFVFILALLSTLGVFGYSNYLVRQNEAKKAAIKKEIEAFEPELTQALRDIKARIDSGKELLNNHLAVSLFLTFLQSVVLRDVFFNDFSFSTSPGESVSVNASGEAPSYASVSFQSDVLEEADFIKSLSFSGLNLNEEGGVVFELKAELDPQVALYKNVILGFPAGPAEGEEAIKEEVTIPADGL